MRPIATVSVCLALAVGLPQVATAANAQSFVASGGDDGAACTRAAACRTFQGAIGKTVPGGQITCLDAADYGPVIITKATSIVCDGPRGAIFLAGDGSAVSIQAGVSDAILLSGLDLRGGGSAGESGVSITSAGSVVIQRSTITGFLYRMGGTVAGVGILDQASSPMTMAVLETRLSNNAIGIGIFPSSGSGISRRSLSHVEVVGNLTGLSAYTSFGHAPVELSISSSAFSQNDEGILVEAPDGPTGDPGVPPIAADIANTLIVGNRLGVGAAGRKASVHIGSSLVANNLGAGLSADYVSTFVSYGDNQIADNGAANFRVTTSPLK
jgi:hypothetical protein